MDPLRTKCWHHVGGCQKSDPPKRQAPPRGTSDALGVLGTIADEIQLQQGTFLEFISDEARIRGGGKMSCDFLFRSAFPDETRLIFLKRNSWFSEKQSEVAFL